MEEKKKFVHIGTSIEHAFNNNVMKIIYGIYGFYDDKLKKSNISLILQYMWPNDQFGPLIEIVEGCLWGLKNEKKTIEKL